MSNLREKIRQIALLIDFEFRKLFRQKSAYFGGIVLLLLTVLCAIAFYYDKLQGRASRKEFAGKIIGELLNGVAFSVTVLLPAIYIILPMIVGIFTASMFAGEYQTGRIRLVALRPVSRWGIYLSKFLSMVVYSYGLLFLLFVVSCTLGWIMFGFSGDVFIAGPVFLGRGTPVYVLNEAEGWPRMFYAYFFAGYTLISIVAMFQMFSAIFKKMATACVVPLGIYYTSYILGVLPFMADLKRFLPTRYIMIWKYTMAPSIDWDSISHDGTFLAIYIFAYLIIGGVVFSNSEV